MATQHEVRPAGAAGSVNDLLKNTGQDKRASSSINNNNSKIVLDEGYGSMSVHDPTAAPGKATPSSQPGRVAGMGGAVRHWLRDTSSQLRFDEKDLSRAENILEKDISSIRLSRSDEPPLGYRTATIDSDEEEETSIPALVQKADSSGSLSPNMYPLRRATLYRPPESIPDAPLGSPPTPPSGLQQRNKMPSPPPPPARTAPPAPIAKAEISGGSNTTSEVSSSNSSIRYASHKINRDSSVSDTDQSNYNKSSTPRDSEGSRKSSESYQSSSTTSSGSSLANVVKLGLGPPPPAAHRSHDKLPISSDFGEFRPMGSSSSLDLKLRSEMYPSNLPLPRRSITGSQFITSLPTVQESNHGAPGTPSASAVASTKSPTGVAPPAAAVASATSSSSSASATSPAAAAALPKTNRILSGRWAKLQLPPLLKKLYGSDSHPETTISQTQAEHPVSPAKKVSSGQLSSSKAAASTTTTSTTTRQVTPPSQAATSKSAAQKRSVSTGSIFKKPDSALSSTAKLPEKPGSSQQNSVLKKLIPKEWNRDNTVLVEKEASSKSQTKVVGSKAKGSSQTLHDKSRDRVLESIEETSSRSSVSSLKNTEKTSSRSASGNHDLSSSNTLFFCDKSTVWDNEEKARLQDIEELSDADSRVAAKARFEARYKIVKQLGSGGHSTVRLAVRTIDQFPVVCKFIKQSSVWHWYTDPETNRKYPLEIQVMREFTKHNVPNIIKYFEHFELNGRFIIIMEYLGDEWIDLYDYVEIYGPVREDISVKIFREVTRTVLFLHNLGFYHNDIKDENILIHPGTGKIKLIDFGSATQIVDPRTDECEHFYGTKKFAAPEAVRGERYNPGAQETWALGTLFFVLLFKLDPFSNDEEILTVDIGRRVSRFKAAAASRTSTVKDAADNIPDISDGAVKALVKMMEKDPAKRISVADILALDVFKL